ncbi:MAG: flavodoxin [Clostridia bacterium]|nr:flavodoxin [Clostridia bacterium]
MSAIIAFFSRAGENYVNGEIKKLSIGNTELMANILHEATGAELFKIEPQNPYSPDYSECINQAKSDQLRNARPKLVRYLTNLEKYDTLYLGFPNYWGTMPMPVFTFLEQCQLSGKRIRLFCTHEGNGFGHSVNDIRQLCPKAVIEIGPAVYGARVAGAKKEIENWLNG